MLELETMNKRLELESQENIIRLEVEVIQIKEKSFSGELFDNGFKIVQASSYSTGKITLKGNFAGEIRKTDNIEVMGVIKEDKYGRYIEVISHKPVKKEENKDWIIDFLQTIKGIGKILANRIVDTIGKDKIYDVIKNDPFKLKEIKGITHDMSLEIYNVFSKNIFLEEYINFILSIGGTLGMALKTYTKLGSYQIEKVKQNPYILSSMGVRFIDCDKMAFNLGIKHDNYIRVSNLMFKSLWEDANNGNIYMTIDDLYDNIRRFASLSGYYKNSDISDDKIKEVISRLSETNNIEVKFDKNMIYLNSNMYDEKNISIALNELIHEVDKDMDYNKIDSFIGDNLDATQKEAITKAIENKISILTGGPGTGKTYTLNYLIKVLKKIDPSINIVLTAPTGKASRRMEELTGVEACTIHKLMNYIPDYEENQLTEIDADFLIVDEVSMINSNLFSKMLNQLKDNTQVLLVGDVNQLPAIGAGDVLRDIIKSNIVPTTKLTKVYRQGSGNSIIDNSYNILNNKPLIVDNKDTFFISNSEFLIKDIQQLLLMSIHNMINNLGYQQDDIQVLTPVKEGPLGVKELNKLIQLNFNKNKFSNIKRNGYNFKVGDKVINTRNNYDLDVFNGDIGHIVDITSDIISVDIKGEIINFRKNEGEFSDLELAYAITVHKSQGSQYKVVILPVHKQSMGGANNNLIYTALTRASEKVVFVGHEDVFYNVVNRYIPERKTLLPLFLGEEINLDVEEVIDFDCKYKGIRYMIKDGKAVYNDDVQIDTNIFDNIETKQIYNPKTGEINESKVVVYKMKEQGDFFRIKNSPMVKHYVFYKDLAYTILNVSKLLEFEKIDFMLKDLEIIDEKKNEKRGSSMILF